MWLCVLFIGTGGFSWLSYLYVGRKTSVDIDNSCSNLKG